MCFADANIVLRYILNDHSELYQRAIEIIEGNEIVLPFEVLCEVVFVLQKVYHVPREQIQITLCDLIDNNVIAVEKKDVLKHALSIYSRKNIDIVDAFLWAYYVVEEKKIFTFDEKLLKFLKSPEEVK